MAWPLLMVGGLGALAQRLSAGAIVAGIVTGISYMYRTKLGLFIMMAMVWLGINFASLKIVLEPAIDLLLGYANGGGGSGGEYATVAWGWLGVMNFDKALTMIVSAVVTRHATMQGRLFLFRRGVGAPP
jgi:hypothetical protein